jgi:N-acyl homoserine lactone hydrolase
MGLKLRVLDLGKINVDINMLVPGTVIAHPQDPNPKGQIIQIPIAAHLIEHPEGNVLYDTGCNPNCMGENGRWGPEFQKLFPYEGGEECQLPNRLQALGLGPDDMRYVVLSHLHNDHAGCVEFFRESQVIVHQDEFSMALRQYGLRNSSSYVWKDTDTWLKSELNWRLIEPDEGDRRLVEGVKILNFGPGHASGMLGLQVALRSQPGVLLVSDACYNKTIYGPPAKMAGFTTDGSGFLRTIHRIRRLAEETGYSVWFGHDREQFESLTKSTEGFYE